MAGGFFLSFIPVLRLAYLAFLVAYIVMCIIEGSKMKNFKIALLVFSGVILTHLVYGVAFLKGALARNLRA